MIDALLGVCLPFGVDVDSVVTTRDGQPLMRVESHAEQPLPEGALDLFRLRILKGDNPSNSGLRIRAVEINGQPVDTPIQEAPAQLDDGGTLHLDLPDANFSQADQLPEVYDIVLSPTGGAEGPGEKLIDPDALLGGYLALRMRGLQGADSVTLRFGYEGGALMPDTLLPVAESAHATLTDHPDREEFEVTVSDLPALVGELAVLACVAFSRAPQGRRTGTVKLRGMQVDGADIPIEEDLSDWTGATGGSYNIAKGTPGGLSVPIVHAPVRAPEK